MQKPNGKQKKFDILKRFYEIFVFDKDDKDISNTITEEEKDSFYIEYDNKHGYKINKLIFNKVYGCIDMKNDYDYQNSIEKYDLQFLSGLYEKYKNATNSNGELYKALKISYLLSEGEEYKSGYYLCGEYEESDEDYNKRLKKYQNFLDDKNKKKEAKKKEREAKKKDKEKILNKLTDKEKKALGLK